MTFQQILQELKASGGGHAVMEIYDINEETRELRLTIHNKRQAFDIEVLGDDAIVSQECTEHHPEVTA